MSYRGAWREVGRGAGKGRGTGHTPAGRGPGLGQEPWRGVVSFLTCLEGEPIGLVSGFTVECGGRTTSQQGLMGLSRKAGGGWRGVFLFGRTVIWRCLCQ